MRIVAARFISIAGHPLVLLPLLIFLPGLQSKDLGAFRNALCFFAMVCLPLSLLMWHCVATGQWSTVDASDKDDRPLLYKASVGLALVAVGWFLFVDPAGGVVRGTIIAAAMLMIAASVNRWIKVSLHLTFACFCGVILARVRLSYGIPVLLLVPALTWSRLVLSRHVLSEAAFGIVLGTLGAACFLCL